MLYYIAGCVFTSKYPEVSRKIQEYIASKKEIQTVRCCVPKYKLETFTNAMPETHRNVWSSTPDCADFQPGDVVYSICHNCSAIIEETKPGVIIRSVWELINEDRGFVFPDYRQKKMTLQDCWRSKERNEEQDAVREILKKMHIEVVELPENRENTDFCGYSLYQPAPPRNLELAPKRFVDGAEGKFKPHSQQEQKEIMTAYCEKLETDEIVAYCHYCVDGLNMGGARAHHLASLLFG